MENHIETYYNAIDDESKYSDIISDWFNELHQYIDEYGIDLLDYDEYTDFFQLCIRHINRELVDSLILSFDKNEFIDIKAIDYQNDE